MVMEDAPKDSEGLAVDSKGNVWLSDRSGAKVCVFSKEGKQIRTIGRPGVARGMLQSPMFLSLCERADLLAVADTPVLIQLFSTKTGEWIKWVLVSENFPQAGFFVTPKRLVYVGYGFGAEAERPPFNARVVFSTNLEGKDLRVSEQVKITKENCNSFSLLKRGFACAYSGELWATGCSVPQQVFLVNEKGEVVKESKPIGSLPSWPDEVVLDLDRQVAAIASVPRAVGILCHGAYIGLICRHGGKLSVDWMDGNLDRVGTCPLELGRPLAPKENIMGAAADSEGNLYVLVVNRERAIPGESTLYRARIQ